jgi:beta-D-xylosidase 4
LTFVVLIDFLTMRSSTFAALAAMAASTMAQNNMSYYDYTTEGNPQLDKRTLATIPLSFPDCGDSPLTDTLVCNTSASAWDRASALISMFTLEELVNNTVNTGPGVPRLGLPPYEVWNEALHGLSHFYKPKEGDFSWVTAFPQPITSMASMNRSLIHQIGSIISTQGRAASNAGRYGLNVYSPNINGFRAPVWGRGQETPGEDAFFLSSLYAYEYITAMQGGVGPAVPKLVSVVKHFAGYDIETWRNHSRLGNDVNITQQDLAGYYTPQFRTAILQAKAKGLMCSYNAVNGEASCSSSFFLQTLLRETWGFGDGFVSGDCGAVYGVFNPHGNAATRVEGSATALLAGTDIDCGTDFAFILEDAFTQGNVSRNDIELAVTRLYSQLVQQGYFDGNGSMYRDLTWDDVLKTDAWNISYEAAVEGIVLLKNDDTLPLKGNSSIALIGPYANATDQMLGNYFTTPPYTISPLEAFKASGRTINYALGTGISSKNETFFNEALAAARKSDVIVFAGGIDNTVESEALDRENITWPGNQLDLIDRLSKLGKPVVVLQMGGGQVDSTVLKENEKVNSIIWGGYPGQSGGQALYDLITGKRAPAGRLVTTQYPAAYADDFYQLDMDLRPSGDNPGQTYMWYTGEPVYAFGHGLFYTTFEEKLATNTSASQSYNITDLFAQPHSGYEFIEQMPLLTFRAEVSNTGKTASDYSAMLFASTTSGPTPRPMKWLVGITREAEVAPGGSCTVAIDVPVGVLARAANNGDLVVYPGDYSLALNNERSVVMNFTLTGDAITVAHWPSELPDNDRKPQV